MKLTLLLTLCTVSAYIGAHLGYALGWLVDRRGIVMAIARALVAIEEFERDVRNVLRVLR